jgi:hypothetical protein
MPLVSGVLLADSSVEADDAECPRPNQLTSNAMARPMLVFPRAAPDLPLTLRIASVIFINPDSGSFNVIAKTHCPHFIS